MRFHVLVHDMTALRPEMFRSRGQTAQSTSSTSSSPRIPPQPFSGVMKFQTYLQQLAKAGLNSNGPLLADLLARDGPRADQLLAGLADADVRRVVPRSLYNHHNVLIPSSVLRLVLPAAIQSSRTLIYRPGSMGFDGVGTCSGAASST